MAFRSLLSGICFSMTTLFACASSTESAPDADRVEQHWDSEDGNPTHATHSIMAELAIKNLARELPETRTYEEKIVEGANLELHELPSKKYEDLRVAVGGNNWAAEHPEVLWTKARASYAAGEKGAAYLYVGVLLHYVQDMGGPAHAFHVLHQSTMMERDAIEVLGFFDFHADFSSAVVMDPAFADPTLYVEWSARTTREHFRSIFGDAVYTRNYFPTTYSEMTPTHWEFIRRREAECARATEYALRSAATALSKL
jgi:hypothetical protein